MVIHEWGGQCLENLSFEEVRVFLNSVLESGSDKCELVVRRCRYYLISVYYIREYTRALYFMNLL